MSNNNDLIRTNEKYKENEQLLRLAHSEDKSVSDMAYNRLVELNMGLVKNIALRFTSRGIELEDLVQIGTLGLIKAIEGFDVERECAFSTYALPVITGEIKRVIRDNGPVKVSRIYKRNAAVLLRERNRIIENEGRDPSVLELAQKCGMNVEEATEALDASLPVVSIYDQRSDDSGITLLDSIECERANEEMSSINDRIALSQEISALPPLWRKIILLRYYRNKTQSECAALLGLTQVKISREEKKILEHLRKKLI